MSCRFREIPRPQSISFLRRTSLESGKLRLQDRPPPGRRVSGQEWGDCDWAWRREAPRRCSLDHKFGRRCKVSVRLPSSPSEPHFCSSAPPSSLPLPVCLSSACLGSGMPRLPRNCRSRCEGQAEQLDSSTIVIQAPWSLWVDVAALKKLWGDVMVSCTYMGLSTV